MRHEPRHGIRLFGGFRWRAAVSVSRLVWVLGGAALLAAAASTRAAEEEEARPDGKGTTKPDDAAQKERQERILELFHASRKSFKDGRIVLEYDFETEEEDLAEDWLPALRRARGRVRWAGPLEGGGNFIDDGIVLGDRGEWVHKAVFLPDVKVTAELMPVSNYRPGNFVAAVFYHPRKKAGVGASSTHQAVCVKGGRFAKPPLPPTAREMQANYRHKVGFVFDGELLQVQFRERTVTDTTLSPGFTRGFDKGHCGISWGAHMQCFLFNVAIDGRLDPEWVDRALEKHERESKKRRRRR